MFPPGRWGFLILSPARGKCFRAGDSPNAPAVALLESSHSRGQEYEADSLGIRRSVAAGFDPAGSGRFLERLIRPERVPGAAYLASHPDPAARLREGRDRPRLRRVEEGGDEIAHPSRP
jgi:predicted Zn-dependent protease